MLEIMKASAGSGKTFNLAEKYIGLLLKNDDRYAYRHILAVTFTNKATDEMKSRILKELHLLATDPLSSDYLNDFIPSLFKDVESIQSKSEKVLCDILHDYSAFAISTIDRFFQQTLKAFSREIGQFASYQVELDKDSLVAESVDRILDSLSENDKGLLEWLTDNVLEQIEQGERYSMDANLLQMAKRLKSPQRKEALEESGLDSSQHTKEDLTSIRNICREIMADFTQNVRDDAKSALEVLHRAGVDPGESTRGFMKGLYLYEELKDNDPVPLPKDSFMKNAPDEEKWFAKAKARKLLPMVFPELKQQLDRFCAHFGKEFAIYNTARILDGQIYGLGVASELSVTFEAVMKEKNVLCIDDSNTILKNIIDGSDAPFVYEKTGVRFDHFLLDEFQDTSGIQWQNFSPLLHNSDASGGENLIVGDVKQSIYRWRGSQWKLLNDEIRNEFPSASEKVLETNWRSMEKVVEFNNAFFTAASKILDGMADGSVSKIYSDVCQKVAPKHKGGGSVELTFCPKEDQLQKVLDTVVGLQEIGASLRDITVLVRSNAIGENIASYLMENGKPVITDDSLKVKNSPVVKRLVSLMSYADNPDDQINGYLATSLDLDLPDTYRSLMDLAESILRSLKKNEDISSDILHVQSFMDALQDYVALNGNNLRGFLKNWDEHDPSISSPSSGDAIRVMTVHKSKGLDFPYVIIPFTESVTLYKAGSYWCRPELKGTPLENVADGVYDVSLSKSSEHTLFADDFKKESLMQQVDNINIMYVAMTRASKGMHLIASVPSAKCLDAISKGILNQFSDMSQILYWFASESGLLEGMTVSVGDDGSMHFSYGERFDFSMMSEKKDSVEAFPVASGGEWPSIPLNPEPGDDEDVRQRGRLKFSADSVDFFSDGEAGIDASQRIKGVIFHDILSRIVTSENLEEAVRDAVDGGEITDNQASEIIGLLGERIAAHPEWFPDDKTEILNETTLIDTDSQMYRPDRILKKGDSIVIIDYKFGEHRQSYVRQLSRYAEIWRRMGYTDVSSYLWYVASDEIVRVV